MKQFPKFEPSGFSKNVKNGASGTEITYLLKSNNLEEIRSAK